MLHGLRQTCLALHEFLKLIERSMLVVDPAGRLEIKQVSAALTKMMKA